MKPVGRSASWSVAAAGIVRLGVRLVGPPPMLAAGSPAVRLGVGAPLADGSADGVVLGVGAGVGVIGSTVAGGTGGGAASGR
ncbi:hypothetical protein KBX39_29045, partial [Micromonospora sp. D75]|nr:hypothetical protein [Micromonospora sp. D75]